MISQYGRVLSKVDRSKKDVSAYDFLGVVSSDDELVDFSKREKSKLVHFFEKRAFEERKKLRDKVGITSSNQDDIEKWFSSIVDELTLSNLSQYRDTFAHRLDSLDKLKAELDPANLKDLENCLETVSEVIDAYKSCLQTIMFYTQSQQYSGLVSFEYDSASRLKLAEHIIEHDFD